MSTAQTPTMPVQVRPLPAGDLRHILQCTDGLWEEIRDSRIFVTGGTGFFGLWLLESFAQANETLKLNAQAVVLTRNPAAFALKAPHLANRKDIAIVVGDVRDLPAVGGSFSHVIHAGTTSSAPLEPEEMFATIVDGTRQVLEFAAEHGVTKLLFVSSGAVYGRLPAGLTHVPEDYAGAPDPLAVAASYGEGKRAAEHLCFVHAQRHGYQVKIARCFAFVGPHLPIDAHFAIGNFIRDVLRGGPIRVGGDGTPSRSYLHAADLAVWLWTLLFRGTSGRAYNVGSGEAHTIAEIAGLVRETCGIETPVAIALPPQGGATSHYVPNVVRAERELGLSVKISLDDAIRRTFLWHQSQQPQ